MLIRDAVRAYLSASLDHYAQGTIMAYSKCLEEFCVWHPNQELENFNQVKLDAFLNRLEKRYKKATVNLFSNSVQGFLMFCFKQKWFFENLKFRKYKKEPPCVKTIFKEDFQKMLDGNVKRYDLNVENNFYEILLRNYVIIQLLIETGIIVSELSRLKVGELDLDKRRIFVQEKNRPDRYLRLSSDTCLLLKDFINRLSLKKDDFLLFRMDRAADSSERENMKPRSIERAVANLSERKFSPKDFKHTFILLNLMSGKGIYEISDLVGGMSDDTKTFYRNYMLNGLVLNCYDYNAYEYLRHSFGKSGLLEALKTGTLDTPFKEEMLEKNN